MQEAAYIGRVFRQDPARLLDDHGDDWPHLVRLAAAQWVTAQENEQARQAEAKAKRR